VDIARIAEFANNHWQLFAALGVIVALLVGTEIRRTLSGVKQVGPVEATRLINHANAIVIDVREDNEYRAGHIVNALHVPTSQMGTANGRLEKYKDRPMILYCRSGQNSARLGSRLRRHGFGAVYNLKGGMLAWQNANLPTSKK
jgi:rhodanese-related sulfurtransferase